MSQPGQYVLINEEMVHSKSKRGTLWKNDGQDYPKTPCNSIFNDYFWLMDVLRNYEWLKRYRWLEKFKFLNQQIFFRILPFSVGSNCTIWNRLTSCSREKTLKIRKFLVNLPVIYENFEDYPGTCWEVRAFWENFRV